MKVGVGILGGGIVGGALAHRLLTGRDEIAAKAGLELELRHLAVRDLGKPRRFTFPEGTLTDDAAAVVADPS